MAANSLGLQTTRSQSNLKKSTSRVSLSQRSPTRPISPSKRETSASPRLNVRPKKVPLTSRDIVVSVKRIMGSAAKSHRELRGSVGEHDSAIVYSAGATVVQCNYAKDQEPTYRYFCAPPDQGFTNDLVNAVAQLNLSTSTPPSRARFQNHTPRARASMGFDIHRGTTPSSAHSTPGGSGSMRNRSKSAKDRIRLLGCVAISPDQSWIAGGEVHPNPTR